ncbi:unnamed protein product [Allacma fusca]|uniref:Uncharacterized protein n=1 Tax=Allacma fusca TaxID=39272 RepID=A0A8J2LSZ9_9HEXA|nr:unnamed protein product [Allacma fusca]
MFLNSVRGQHKHGVTFQLSQMQDWKSPMEIDVRSMHRFCTGECFYIPESCKNTLKALNCKNIVAIQKYEPPCHNPEATDSTDLCTRQGHLFIVSVLRTVSQGIVEPKRYIYKTDEYGYDIRCKVEPFVAISFSNNTEDYLTPTDPEQNKLGDVFYVCVAGDPYVTAWVKPKKKLPKTTPSCLDDFNPSESLGGTLENMQLLDTRPYPPMGPAVLWSKITTRYDQLAMGCKFVISNLRKDLSIQLNINGTVQVPLIGQLELIKALCFTRGDEPVCSTKKSCHYLFAVQALNPQFSSLRFYLLAQPLRRPGIYNRVHPKSWSGAAYNADSMSIFTPDNEPSLVDLLPVTNFVDSSIDATLCIFDVSTTLRSPPISILHQTLQTPTQRPGPRYIFP